MSDEEDEPKRRRRRAPAGTGSGAAASSGSGSGSASGSGSGPGPGQAAPGRADLAVRVKTARGRKISSTAWLKRQLNDPYVQRAKAAGYRSRAAFKLVELDDKFELLRKGARVVDLGAAPGGWCQVALERGAGEVVGVDLLEMEPVAGTTLLVGDFTDEACVEAVRAAMSGPADLVLSDMAANATGHRPTDHIRIVALVDAAATFAEEVLTKNGAFVAKVLQGGTEAELLVRLKHAFSDVRHAKPPASRADSAETYLVARGFRGRAATD